MGPGAGFVTSKAGFVTSKAAITEAKATYEFGFDRGELYERVESTRTTLGGCRDGGKKD